MGNIEGPSNPERKGGEISRRDFLKMLAGAGLGAAAAVHGYPLRTATASGHQENPLPPEKPQNTQYGPETKCPTEDGFSPPLYEDICTIFDNIKKEFYGGGKPYSMEPGSKNHCSALAGKYMEMVGYQMVRFTSPNEYKKLNIDPLSLYFPDANTVAQAQRLEELNEALDANCVTSLHLSEAKGMDWGNITPGSLVYFRVEGITQHGKDQMQHVAIFIGINKDGKSEFADFALGMEKGPNRDRSFEQVARGVYGRATYDESNNEQTRPSDKVEIFDVHQLLWELKQRPEFPG
jgi:hypothetical protein